MELLDIGSAVRELLNGIPTIIKGLRNSYESILQIKDKAAARRDIARLQRVSEAFGKLMFEPGGLRDRLHEYLVAPKSRLAKANLKSALNQSQLLYQECLQTLDLSVAFKARHPELMTQLTEYHKQKGRLISGIGDRIKWPLEEHLTELEDLEPLFEKVNRGINEVRTEIKGVLLEFDRQEGSAKKKRAAKAH
jgi:hypothetical protein